MTQGKISVLVPDLSFHGTTRSYVIATGLQKLGYQVNIFGFLFGKQIYPEPPRDLPITYFHGKKLPSLLKLIFDLSREIDGDILYVVKPQLTSFGVGLVKAYQGKKPIILDLDDWEMGEWGGDDWQYRGNIIRDLISSEGSLRKPGHPFFLKWLEKAMSRVNAITVSSKFLEYRYGGTYLPNGVDTDIFDPSKYNGDELRAIYGLSDFKLLMFCGTVRENQGIELILQALDSLNNPQLKLVLVGGNPQETAYRDKLMEKWAHRIILITPQPFNGVASAIALSHIVIVTPDDTLSSVAKCPLKLLEAMAMAKPIMATKVGEIPQILGDNGYFITTNNHSAYSVSCAFGIAQTIQTIFEDYETAQKKGQQAREVCQAKYSTETIKRILQGVISLCVS